MATATRTMTSQMFSARRFIGKDVFDVNGQHVGEVEDLILGVQTACAKWSIVSTGGVLGIGEKYRIVPIQGLSIEQDTGRLMLQFAGDRLASGPLYDRNNPPDWSDENWSRSVMSFYGMESYAGGMGGGGQSYEQGYQQGYQQGMQQGSMQQGSMQQGSMQQGSMQQGSMYSGQERRMSGSSGYMGMERRHMMSQQQGAGMQPIGRQQQSMEQGGQGSMHGQGRR